MKAASKLGKLHRQLLTSAAAVALATGWAMAGKGATLFVRCVMTVLTPQKAKRLPRRLQSPGKN
jgi:hypothetical protein